MKPKIKFIVIEENILAYVNSRLPEFAYILASSIIKGASVTWLNGPICFKFSKYRPASVKDFETFRVNVEGYLNDKYYDYEIIRE
jgi:hypothetical protein